MDTTGTLTDEQIEAFQRDGFVFAPGFHDPAHILNSLDDARARRLRLPRRRGQRF